MEPEQPEISEPIDLAADDVDAIEFEPAAPEPEEPEPPAEGPEEAADAEAELSATSNDADDGDPGIRKILEHVREEIEAKRNAAG